MDGMNPTLAFAVLLFGLSGNARDDAVDPTAQIEASGSVCPVLMIVANPSAPASQTDLSAAFELDADVSPLPDVTEPAWVDAAPAAMGRGSDPIMRRMALAGMNAPAAEPDPCATDR